MPRSSSGPGHRPLKAEIIGSNPIRGTQRVRLGKTPSTMQNYPPAPPSPQDRYCGRNVSPRRSTDSLRATVYLVVIVFLGGIIGAIVQVLASTPAFNVTPDIRIGLALGGLAGAAVFAVALYADAPRCPICKSKNVQAPR